MAKISLKRLFSQHLAQIGEKIVHQVHSFLHLSFFRHSPTPPDSPGLSPHRPSRTPALSSPPASSCTPSCCKLKAAFSSFFQNQNQPGETLLRPVPALPIHRLVCVAVMRVVHVERQLLSGLKSLLTELTSLDLLRLLLHLVDHGFAELSLCDCQESFSTSVKKFRLNRLFTNWRSDPTLNLWATRRSSSALLSK